MILLLLCGFGTPYLQKLVEIACFSLPHEQFGITSVAVIPRIDMSACYDLKRKIFNTKQGNLPVTDYFGVLNSLWIELDQYQKLKMECSQDTIILNAVIKRDRIFDFLAGLNVEFDPIRVQILGKEKLPNLTEVFYTVRSEETRRHAMLSEHLPDVSALVANKGPQPSPSIFFCEHCNKS
jgi:hypothetical protein